LPVLAVDLSFKQKHPANNASAGRFARISGAAAKILWNRMMSAANTPFIWLGSPAKSAFWQGPGRPAGGPQFLT
jgi:hypothetical protein